MSKIILMVLSMLIPTFMYSKDNKLQKFYVGTYTREGGEGIYLCSLDTQTGEISLERTFKALDNPSFVVLSPDKKYLYSVAEITTMQGGKAGGVSAFHVDEKGDLHFLNKQSSHGTNPCHVGISKDGKYIIVSNYSSGSVALFPVKQDGSLGESSTVIQNEGSGADKSRQGESHAHSSKFSPFTDEVFNADLGTDQLNIFHLKDGQLKQSGQKFVKMTPGAGPRHFEFHPNGEVIYVISELNSTVSVLRKKNNEWKVVQEISTLPAGFKGESYCADIHISNDGKYLYGSNRGDNSVAVFEVNEKDQSLKMLETVSVEGNWPRNFGITPDGNWLLVANQRSGNITVFNVNQQDGSIKYSGKEIQLPSPVCVEFY
ncbi:lactonase family protein [Maribellus sp. YY47]|uniref:lactonase family protein n=1 Tax=Maribellus sp. YY47 TaxID=2929486 RepID=UPI0020019D8D|nr:lactonase family protein [Maribellus sp. YY47]MCK3682949.1 lactonase family protein [Maribellus sp. YY47]